MTGFGRFEASEGDRKVTVEIKSVNHRYLELGIKVPKKLNFLEGDIRNELKNTLKEEKLTYSLLMKIRERAMNV